MILMGQNIQQVKTAALLKKSERLLSAHQHMINAWYAAWLNEQRARAAQVLGKKEVTEASQVDPHFLR